MPPAARVLDPTAHGAPLSPGPGSMDVMIGGQPAWRAIIDQHACPAVNVSGADGVGSVMMGSLGVMIDGQMACRVLDIVVEKPGLAMGPINPIVVGCFTVMIGDMGAGVSAPPTDYVLLHPADLKQALKDQAQLLREKKKELSRWNAQDQANFKKWFGKDDEASRKTMQDRIDKMLALNKSFRKGQFKTATPPDENTYAYVNPADPTHTINLDRAFQKAPPTGEDSKAGTLAHEMSHFNDIGGTQDYQYGSSDCKNLAKKDPDKAMNNADSFEYYVEGAH